MLTQTSVAVARWVICTLVKTMCSERYGHGGGYNSVAKCVLSMQEASGSIPVLNKHIVCHFFKLEEK